ncbi:WXG100-like domain-containing protein [Nocardia paucivorans]|uniref:WXG100-like domain-containing protein n=1 Tax=Nocardia paucivorans TaxID=114259 RepID=UPI0005934582|nr:hypothetical protein [Nocardia paucivorans]
MSIQIPSEVVFLLNLLGLPYPDINADDVRKLSQHVGDFATDVRETHESATGVVNDMGSVYSGDSYQALLVAWSRMSTGNMAQLDSACRMVAKALDIAADVIEAVQVAVLTELAALAVAYAAVMLTPAGLTMRPLVTMAARRLLSSLQETLVWYIAAEVLGKAIEPLEDKIEQMISGALYDAASDVLGVTPGSAKELHIEPDEVLRYAKVLDDHADAMLAHAEKFAEKVATLDFTTPGLDLPVGDEPLTTPDLLPSGVQPNTRLFQPSLIPQEFSAPPPEVQRPLTAIPSDHPSSNEITPNDGRRRDRGGDPSDTTAPASETDRQTTAPSAPATSAEPGRPFSASDNPADRVALDDPNGKSMGNGSTTGEATTSPSRAASAPGLDSPAITANTPSAASASTVATGYPAADTAPAGAAETLPWAQGRTSSSVDANEQLPAAAAPAGQNQGGTGQNQGGTDRSPARSAAAAARPSSRSQTAQTPWSKAGRAMSRVVSAAKRSTRRVSAGQTDGREQTTDTPWSKTGSARDTGPQVFAPTTAPPTTAPPAKSDKPDEISAPERDRDAPTPAPAQTVAPPPSENQPPKV